MEPWNWRGYQTTQNLQIYKNKYGSFLKLKKVEITKEDRMERNLFSFCVYKMCKRKSITKRKREFRMEQTYYLISDAAKQVQVESHVLRYWEEELGLPIHRNELGHRFYTEEDIKRFISIKNLKEKGLQLKAIKLVLQDDGSFEKEERAKSKEVVHEEEKGQKILSVITKTSIEPENKAARMQILLKQLMMEAIRDSNEELCDNLKETLLKELDYQFRLQEEREEEREDNRSKKEEEHFKKIDTLLRDHSSEISKKEKKEKKKKRHSFF